jgi:hypothetical protein
LNGDLATTERATQVDLAVAALRARWLNGRELLAAAEESQCYSTD